MIPAPDYLDLEARACWYRVQSSCRARGVWESVDVLALEVLAVQCASYLAFAREVRALRTIDAEALKDLETGLMESHRIAREWLVSFMMIPANRVPFSVMNAEGLDKDIADLCAPFEPGGAPLENDR